MLLWLVHKLARSSNHNLVMLTISRYCIVLQQLGKPDTLIASPLVTLLLLTGYSLRCHEKHGKVKLSPCLTNYALHQEHVRGGGWMYRSTHS
jgi:hypothetical protein